METGGKLHAPAALPPGKTRYILYRGLVGYQGRSGRVRKISPPPEFDSRTVHPVASRCTDWATPAHRRVMMLSESQRRRLPSTSPKTNSASCRQGDRCSIFGRDGGFLPFWTTSRPTVGTVWLLLVWLVLRIISSRRRADRLCFF